MITILLILILIIIKSSRPSLGQPSKYPLRDSGGGADSLYYGYCMCIIIVICICIICIVMFIVIDIIVMLLLGERRLVIIRPLGAWVCFES